MGNNNKYYGSLSKLMLGASFALFTSSTAWAVQGDAMTLHADAIESVLQQQQIKGTVVDASGEPVIGANVLVKGTTNGTITDLDGAFTLNAPSKCVLQISFIGYLTQEVKVTSSTTNLKVKLKEDTETLEEVVVVGYGTQKKGSVATSIATVKSDVIQNRPVKSVGEALQGTVPGLQITSSASPGSAPGIQLRGHSSLNGGGSPLVLVDGVPADFNFLNPEDIESVSVLKDAASAAIYGSRAANGVLLITTKRGKQGKPTFRYNGSVGVNTPSSLPGFVGSAEYARVRNEAETNMGRRPMYTEEDIQKLKDGTDPNRYPNTNWLDLALKNSFTTRHAIEASGGTDAVRYMVSGSLDHQTGVFPRTTHDVFNVRSSTDINVTKKIKFSTDIRYQLRDLQSLGNQNDLMKQILCMKPDQVAYYTDGTYGYNEGFFPNALVSINEGGQNVTKRHEASGIFKIDYEIIKGLKFTGIANVRFTNDKTEGQSRMLKYTDFFTKETVTKGANGYSEKANRGSYYNLQALLNYRNSFGKHNLDVLAGYQQENAEDDWLSGARSGYPTDIITELNPGPKEGWTNGGSGSHWSLASFIGRVNYDYANKYILSMSMRADASSRFNKDKRWASFPSVALAWRLTQESFMENTKSFLDDMKLRVSWGQAGSATGLGLYPSYSTIGMGGIVLGNKYSQVAGLGSIGNPDLGWERSEMLNFGVDATILKNRLNFTFEYYIKNTKDILLNMPVPWEYGFGKQKVNIGQMRNKGWELTLGWHDKVGDFSYSATFNLSNNENEVVDLAETGPWKGSNTYTEEGKPFNQIYGYESMGLFQSEDEVKNAPFQNSKTGVGDVRYKDQNGDNKIDANDRVVLGDPFAHLLYGLKFDFAYKGFDLGMFFQGVGKQDRIITDGYVRSFYDTTIFEHQLDYWTPENRDAEYPRILFKDDGSHNYQYSDYWKINAGYLRMKNLTLGYTLPKNWLASTGLQRVRLYFTANNLFTISDFVPGMDPELPSAVSYPFAKTYSFGLNVQF